MYKGGWWWSGDGGDSVTVAAEEFVTIGSDKRSTPELREDQTRELAWQTGAVVR